MKKDNQNNEIIETSAKTGVFKTEKENSFKSFFSKILNFFKKFKSKKIKNQALWRKGGYSFIITALVLTGLIVFNWLIGVLGDRYHLEFDMTPDKKNSISDENIDFIENLENEVNITICGTKENFANYVLSGYYYSSYYSTGYGYELSAESDYFTQATNFIDLYPTYNEKISVEYLDPQGTKFAAFSKEHSSLSIYGGEIIVTSPDNDRVKVLSADDIFNIDTQSGMYSGGHTITSSKLETALTSAVAYVSNNQTKKIALLTGHGGDDYISAYTQILEINNYEIEVIDDTVLTEISDEYDVIAILAPSVDYLGSEIDAITAFLDNDGKQGKGLVFFADATRPALPNLYSFLKQWGISIEDGVLFETNSSYHVSGSHTGLAMFPSDIEDDLLSDLGNSVTDYNVPMTTCDAFDTKITSKVLVESSPYNVIAPLGSDSSWADYTDSDKKTYAGVVQATYSDYDQDNNNLTSYIVAFSSVEFIHSTYSQQYSNYNQDITVLCTERAAHIDTKHIFTAKIITNEMFTAPSEEATDNVENIFVIALPLLVVATGIFIYVRRRNAR